MQAPRFSLAQLGWTPFFSGQVSDDERQRFRPVRVMSVHRGTVSVMGDGIDWSMPSAVPVSKGPEDRPTVGDWLLIDEGSRSVVRILDRTSLLKRPSPVNGRRIQLIAANVDTLFIVTSCDQDFNIARLERYLVLAGAAGVRPVIILTKADLSPDPKTFVEAARALGPDMRVALVNGRDAGSVAILTAHLGPGETVALVGSSGVGKSTLVNSMTGSDSAATQPVRESDGKGLHTTTVRQMHRFAVGSSEGGWLVDTPGVRELQMSEVGSGVTEVFDDIVETARDCRFADCNHVDAPGCAIQAAIASGALDPMRVERWRKLASEDALNSEHAAVRRARMTRGTKTRRR